MASLILDYYRGKDLYSDGNIEERILKFVQHGYSLDHLEEQSSPEDLYVFLYHLSKIRENILNWYPFKKGCRILEIGSGCGAITEMLCKRAGFVTSVELSKQRATINYTRHKHLKNLEIIVGNINDLQENADYDYVVINGVLEYACSFTDGDKPFEDFLRKIHKFLKRSGCLLVAIENRLGLKYFAGAPEDHTDRCFWGIEGYPNDNSVRTFSKTELECLLKQSGFSYLRFYYPYPDYKFPSEIFSDYNINSGEYGRKGVYFQKEIRRLFDEKSTAESFAKEKVLDKFANSFLVEAQLTHTYKTNIIYAKLNSTRVPRFAIGTSIIRTIWGSQKVIKWPLCSEAEQHVFSTFQNSMRDAWNLKGKKKDGYIEYPFLRGGTLSDCLKKVPQKQRAQRLIEMAQEIMSLTSASTTEEREDFYTKKFQAMFGTKKLHGKSKCIENPNIDLILDNIFRTVQGYRIIDCEWYVEGWIPQKLILWRLLNEMYNQDEMIARELSFDKLLKKVDITPEESECFRDWSNHFAENYVQQSYVKKYQKSNELLDITDQICDRNRTFTNLYIDSGQGFSESEKIRNPLIINADESFETIFDLSAWDQIYALRWDPVEREVIKCNNMHFFLDDQEVSFQGTNQEPALPGLFVTLDPQYLYTTSQRKYTSLKIKGKIIQLNKAEAVIKVFEKDLRKELKEK